MSFCSAVKAKFILDYGNAMFRAVFDSQLNTDSFVEQLVIDGIKCRDHQVIVKVSYLCQVSNNYYNECNTSYCHLLNFFTLCLVTRVFLSESVSQPVYLLVYLSSYLSIYIFIYSSIFLSGALFLRGISPNGYCHDRRPFISYSNAAFWIVVRSLGLTAIPPPHVCSFTFSYHPPSILPIGDIRTFSLISSA